MDLREVVADLCSEDPSMSPRWVLTLLGQLPDTAALPAAIAGGREWRGWGHDRQLLAGIFDAINTNTKATGNFKRPPQIDPWPRPGAGERPKLRLVSLGEALPA